MYALALVLVVLIGSASAFFTATSSRSVVRSLKMSDERSVALPFDKRPANLDGTLPGDFGFDPAGFSNNPPKSLGGGFKWYRESEIVHGRVAQLAVFGVLFQGYFPGVGVFSETDPIKAFYTAPSDGLWHIFATTAIIEIYRSQRIILGDKEPGDLNLGQGGWNPFGFNYTPEEYREKQVQEIKHGRLAMIGSIGQLLQSVVSGKGVVQQLSEAFSFPDAVKVVSGSSDLADYFPPGL